MSAAQHTERSPGGLPSGPRTPAATPVADPAALADAEAEMADETVDGDAQAAAASQAGLESQGDYADEMDGTRAAGGAASADLRSHRAQQATAAPQGGAQGAAVARSKPKFEGRYANHLQVCLLRSISMQMDGTLPGRARNGTPVMHDSQYNKEILPITNHALKLALTAERDEAKGPEYYGARSISNPMLEDPREHAAYGDMTDYTSFRVDAPPPPPPPPPLGAAPAARAARRTPGRLSSNFPGAHSPPKPPAPHA